MKLKKATKILIIICVIGLSLLLYPSFSNYWNSTRSTSAINSYSEYVNEIDEENYRKLWADAVAYNEALAASDSSFVLPPELEEQYSKLLDLTGIGVMGYIEIPSIDVSLPVYHGTEDNVLQIAVGHLDWSSLPTGGLNTHCVLSGHRGLPSAKLFTDLDALREGDIFVLTVLKETLTYEVDQIRTVEPDDLSDLRIDPDKDYCTLVTCTPYGVNTHRLLVRGHRVENLAGEVRVVSEAVIIEPLVVAPIVAFPFLFTLLMMVMLKKPEKKPETPSSSNS